MALFGERARELARELSPAEAGIGPLLERDYWVVIQNCRLKPSEVVQLVSRRFPEFAPKELAWFRRPDGSTEPLAKGDELEVQIRGAGTFGVRVLHRDSTSFTIGTLTGHPEAGRITFGAYRNGRGDVIFHIRSRARSGSRAHYAGFVALGDAMQTNCWTDFVNRVALSAGDGVVGWIHADKRKHRRRADNPEDLCGPTFVARSD